MGKTKLAKSRQAYPALLRRVRNYDSETKKKLVFITNNLEIPALTVAMLYKGRWSIELFFRWIKQHLRIKVFYGTSLNAVKTQIWIAVTTFLRVAMIHKQMKLSVTLYITNPSSIHSLFVSCKSCSSAHACNLLISRASRL